MARAALQPGDEVGGYRLGEVLGAGGLGTVFATRDAAGAALAIKVVAHGGDEALRKRVAREVTALQRIDHPHVLRLVDAGADAVWSYLVMPRIEGTTLRELVSGGPLSPEAAALVLLPAARGVGAIHRAGLCHRDVKPDNVMIDGDGRVVIIDLGLALAPDWSRQTTEGSVAGSLPYMAPEQIEGEATAASDVWALGVTWWELLVGRRPFARGRAVEEVAAIAGGARPHVGEVERRLDEATAALVERCLAADPAHRPATGDALAVELERSAGAAEDRGALIRLCRDRAAWEAEVAGRVATQCAARAGELASAGDVFAAMRAIDRGLAYAPADPELHALLARIMPSPGVATATGTPRRPTELDRHDGALAPTQLASPRPAPAPPVGRRGWWLAAVIADPRAVVQALIDAARDGDATFLPELCVDDSDDLAQRLCDARPGGTGWPKLRELFADAVVDGAYRTADGATINLRFGAGAAKHGTLELFRRRDRYYLRGF